jgi:cell wall-associated NlpC family hydrolase
MGVNLPRVASSMAQIGESVSRDELKPGDLVFFNTRGKRYSHVGIYVGENKFVHSPRTGAVVRVDKMDNVYWNKRYNGARRLEGQRVASR